MEIAKLLRAVRAGAVPSMLRWPRFSVTSFLVTRQLRDAGVLPATVVDVGANVGQFAVAAAKVLRSPRIFSFEPTPDCYDQLRRATAGLGVECVPMAVGDYDGPACINANLDSRSNSILDATDLNLREFPGARTQERIAVEVVRLDTYMVGRSPPRPTLLKIDTQGFELQVLEGAVGFLDSVDWILIELSFEPMYRGERSAGEILAWLRDRGWRLQQPMDFLAGRGGRILQMDALLARGTLP